MSMDRGAGQPPTLGHGWSSDSKHRLGGRRPCRCKAEREEGLQGRLSVPTGLPVRSGA